MKYIIYDVCCKPGTSTYIDQEYLDKPIPFEKWLERLTLEIKSYVQCYEGCDDQVKKVQLQFIMNMVEALKGDPIQINGLEFHVIKED